MSSSALSLGTGVLEIGPVCCGDSSTQIGLDVYIADRRWSTSGYALMLNGAAISWKSKRQSLVALSTAEAEYIAASTMV